MTPSITSAPTQKHAPLAFLGLACAVGVSTIYYNQPLLLEMGHSYHARDGQTMFVSVATQVGYACGLLLFVPLGDVLERRGLMMKMYAAVAVALVLVAVAPTLTWLLVASVAAGMLASVTHIVLPIAPDLVDDAQRGRAIGTVMTGLLLGILLARTFSGWVSHATGWRWVVCDCGGGECGVCAAAVEEDATAGAEAAAAVWAGDAIAVDAGADATAAAGVLRGGGAGVCFV